MSRLLLLSALLFVSARGRAADGAAEGGEVAAAEGAGGIFGWHDSLRRELKEKLAEVKAKLMETASHVDERLEKMKSKSAQRAAEARASAKALRERLASVGDAQAAFAAAAAARAEKTQQRGAKLLAKLDKFGASLASGKACVAERARARAADRPRARRSARAPRAPPTACPRARPAPPARSHALEALSEVKAAMAAHEVARATRAREFAALVQKMRASLREHLTHAEEALSQQRDGLKAAAKFAAHAEAAAEESRAKLLKATGGVAAAMAEGEERVKTAFRKTRKAVAAAAEGGLAAAAKVIKAVTKLGAEQHVRDVAVGKHVARERKAMAALNENTAAVAREIAAAHAEIAEHHALARSAV